MRYTYPHTIDNGSGEQITFLRIVTDATGEWLEVENWQANIKSLRMLRNR